MLRSILLALGLLLALLLAAPSAVAEDCSWQTGAGCDDGGFRPDPWTRIVTTADATNSNGATWVEATQLTWTAQANKNYLMRCDLRIMSTSASIGVQFQVKGPATPTSVEWHRTYSTAGSGGASAINGAAFHASNEDDGTAGSCHVSSPCTLPFTMILRNGANAGPVSISIQPEVDANEVEILAGSICELMRF